MRTPLPAGVGLGWRPPIAGHFADLDVPFVEVISELVCHVHPAPVSGARRRSWRGAGSHRDHAAPGAHVPELLARLREQRGPGFAVIPHAVSVNLGSADAFDPRHAEALAASAAALDAPLASEHISFTRAGGVDVGHLTPLPRTREAVAVLARNTAVLQSMLDVPLALENIAPTLTWPDDELTEAEFVAAVCDATGAYLLLDVHNVYARAVNAGLDPVAELLALPLDRIAYCHVAGGRRNASGTYVDTHSMTTPQPVLDMCRELSAACGELPFLLERDSEFPPLSEIRAELGAIAAAAREGAAGYRVAATPEKAAGRGAGPAGGGPATAPTSPASTTSASTTSASTTSVETS